MKSALYFHLYAIRNNGDRVRLTRYPMMQSACLTMRAKHAPASRHRVILEPAARPVRPLSPLAHKRARHKLRSLARRAPYPRSGPPGPKATGIYPSYADLPLQKYPTLGHAQHQIRPNLKGTNENEQVQ